MNIVNPLSQNLAYFNTFFFLTFFVSVLPLPLFAQFREDFNAESAEFRSNGLPQWSSVTGDGEGIFTQNIQNGIATLRLDASQDKRNIWYAFAHRNISAQLNVKSGKGFTLYIEAKVKPSHGPRRVNLFLKSLASQDEYLREFDLPEAGKWHEISMVAPGFHHTPGQPLLAQVSFMDWGNTGIYELQVDYIKVDIIKPGQKVQEKGLPLMYRPPLADESTFRIERKVAADVSIDRQFSSLNLSGWTAGAHTGEPVLMVDGNKFILLRWDFPDLKGKKVTGAGQLEFYTHSLYQLSEKQKDFGEVRICELIGANPDWQESNITYESLFQTNPPAAVINEQTIVDTAIMPAKGSKTRVTISQPVLQRLIDGTTKGLAILPLGLISATLMDSKPENGRFAATLRLNVE